MIAREREFAFDAEGVLATKGQDWESLLPPGERSSRMAMVAAADDYFGMFAAAPEVRTPRRLFPYYPTRRHQPPALQALVDALRV